MSDFIAQYEDNVKPSDSESQDKVEKTASVEKVVEEQKELAKNDEPQTEVTEETNENPIEQEARSQGWVPEGEWDGDPTQWRDAQVFLERGEYFKTMGSQKKQIDKLNAVVEKMATIQAKTRENERTKVLKELSEQKVQAMEEGEYARIVDIDNEMDKIRAEPAMSVPATAGQGEDEYTTNKIAEYVDNNKWYRTSSDMREYADTVAVGYKTTNPQATIDDILEYTDSQVKSRYPEKFGNQAPSASPVAVTGRTTKPSSKRTNQKKTLNDLPANSRDMYAQIGQSFVDAGAVNSIDEYIAELEKIGEL